MSGGELMAGILVLSGGLYGLYRLGIWLERRHQERCTICGCSVDLGPRNWTQQSHYWDSASQRWSHLQCKLEQVQEFRKAGGL